jgi:lipoprotein-anchoring transpeptidase ErfK/SrfK
MRFSNDTRWFIGSTALVFSLIGSTAVGGVLRHRQPELRVDLSERVMRVMDGSEEVQRYGVAVGSRKHPTPRGTFRTGRMVWNPGWVPPNSEWARDEKPRAPGDPKNPMRGVKIYFREPAYYIHGTNAPGSIGQAASHGCIRMRESDAVRLGRWIESQGGSVRLVIKR